MSCLYRFGCVSAPCLSTLAGNDWSDFWDVNAHLIEGQLLLRALVDIVAQLWDDFSVGVRQEHFATLDLRVRVGSLSLRSPKYLGTGVKMIQPTGNISQS